MRNILEVKNLTKKYKKFTLNNIEFTLPEGCIMGMIGANGAGKSTILKSILGLVQPDSGEITMFGETKTKKEMSCDKELKEQVGVVLDQANFPDGLTAKEMNKIMNKCYKTWNQDTYQNYLRKFRIDEEKKIKEYSRGMTMKLSMAIALSHDSKLLILDEATSGLDPIIRDGILDILQEFIQDESKSVLISSHILSDLEKICDYITFIHDGQVIVSEEKDVLIDKFCIVKGGAELLEDDKKAYMIGSREGQYGIEALVLREDIRKIGSEYVEAAKLEDIMLYLVKGEK